MSYRLEARVNTQKPRPDAEQVAEPGQLSAPLPAVLSLRHAWFTYFVPLCSNLPIWRIPGALGVIVFEIQIMPFKLHSFS